MTGYNLSYKQLQEELKKRDEELKKIKDLFLQLQSLMIEYTGITRNVPCIVLKEEDKNT